MLCDIQREDVKGDVDPAVLAGALMLEPQALSVRKQR